MVTFLSGLLCPKIYFDIYIMEGNEETYNLEVITRVFLVLLPEKLNIKAVF